MRSSRERGDRDAAMVLIIILACAIHRCDSGRRSCACVQNSGSGVRRVAKPGPTVGGAKAGSPERARNRARRSLRLAARFQLEAGAHGSISACARDPQLHRSGKSLCRSRTRAALRSTGQARGRDEGADRGGGQRSSRSERQLRLLGQIPSRCRTQANRPQPAVRRARRIVDRWSSSGRGEAVLFARRSSTQPGSPALRLFDR